MKPELVEGDKLWQKVVHNIVGNRCEYGVSEGCTGMAYNGAHHIIPRYHWKVRYDVMNAICVCPRCHDHIHAHEVDFMDWLKENKSHVYDWIEAAKRSYDALEEGRMDECIEMLKTYCRAHSI